jgi:hypothetical protein
MPNASNLKPFKRGKDERRNTVGRPKGSRNLSTVLREMLQEIAPKAIADAKFVKDFCRGKKRITLADAMAARLLMEAIVNGELSAIQQIADRTEGKPKQSLDLGNESGEPLVITFDFHSNAKLVDRD